MKRPRLWPQAVYTDSIVSDITRDYTNHELPELKILVLILAACVQVISMCGLCRWIIVLHHGPRGRRRSIGEIIIIVLRKSVLVVSRWLILFVIVSTRSVVFFVTHEGPYTEKIRSKIII